MTTKPSILIVGAGPTGLVIAHELARSGIDCRVISKDPHRAMQSRAIAIHPRTIESLELMGLADDFLAAGQRITGLNTYGATGRIAHVDFGSLATRYPYVLGVPQDETERILEEHVGKLGVAVERDTELAELTAGDTSLTAGLRKNGRREEVKADWVLGCDGAHSGVREQLGISFEGSTYPEHFVLADVRVDGGLDHNEAAVWLPADGPTGFFPLPEHRWRLIVANSPPEWDGKPSLAQCQELVDKRGLGHLRLADPRWIAVFRIHRREAGRFRQNRVFLLGDAAHIHSPVGGQGMNMGIQDACNLAWKLDLVLGGNGKPGLLDSYEPERRPIDEAVLRQTDRATRLMSLHGTAARFVRDHLMALVARLPAAAERLGEAISGIGMNYRHSPIVADHAGGAPGPRAGDRAPDAQLDDRQRGAATRLYQLLARHRHVLLLVGGGAAELPAVPEIERLPVAVCRVSAAGGRGGELIDANGEVTSRYGAAPTAYLIRPDGYIGFRCGSSELSRLLPGYLEQIFTTH